MTAGERPPIPERLQELVEDRLEGLPARDDRSPRGRLGPVGADARCDRCGDRSFPRGRPLDWVLRSRTASSRSSATALRFTHPLLLPPSIRRSRWPGVASCTRGSRRSSAIRRNEPATWLCPSRARTSPSPPPSRRPPCWPLPGERRSPRPSSGRWPAAPRRGTEVRTWCVGPTTRAWRTSSAGTLAGAERPGASGGPLDGRAGSGPRAAGPGDGPRRDRRLAGGLGRVRGCSGRGGGRSRAAGTDRAEPRVRLAVQGRPRGIGTARSRRAAAGRGAAGTTGDGRSVPGVSIRRVPPRTRGRSGAARSRDRPGRAHGGRVQIPCPACELRRGAAPQVHRSPGRGPPDVHRAPW